MKELKMNILIYYPLEDEEITPEVIEETEMYVWSLLLDAGLGDFALIDSEVIGEE